MTLHRNLALASLAILAGAAVWRWRRPLVRGAAATAVVGALGLGVVSYLGGEMVYSHALGLSNDRITRILDERGRDLMVGDSPAVTIPERADSAAADSAGAATTKAKKGHTHAPGQEP